jgi:hypothetical protein
VRRDVEAFRNAGVSDERIMAELEITAELLDRILAVDGVVRCVECAFDRCTSCMQSMRDDRTSRLLPCECDCTTP